MAVDPVIIGGGLKLLAGLFGKKEKVMTPGQSIMSTAQGVTDAAAATGINRLTLLGASNATAGAGISMGGPPPLASALSQLGDFVGDNFSSEAKARQEHTKLSNELLRLEVDRSRTLAKVATAPTWAGSSSFSGGRVQTRTHGPVKGDFLNEDDRNAAVADERDGTASIQSQGEQTVVPVGPDIDEILAGVVIDTINKKKARERRTANMTVGKPYKSEGWRGLPAGQGVLPERYFETPKPKKPPVPLKSWEQSFTLN